MEFIAFVALLAFGAFLLVRLAARSLASVIKAQLPAWLVQWGGLTLGAARGFWWAGVVMLMILAAGPRYLAYSVWSRSLVGRPLVSTAARAISGTANCYPGGAGRGELIPGLTLPPQV